MYQNLTGTSLSREKCEFVFILQTYESIGYFSTACKSAILYPISRAVDLKMHQLLSIRSFGRCDTCNSFDNSLCASHNCQKHKLEEIMNDCSKLQINDLL